MGFSVLLYLRLATVEATAEEGSSEAVLNACTAGALERKVRASRMAVVADRDMVE